MQKIWHGLLLIIVMLLLVLVQQPGSTLKMVVCDVGQGDGILIIKGQTQVLVDGGPSGERMLACLEKYIPFWDRTIELIVLTNTDYDHMNGLSDVVDRYTIMQFVTSDGVHKSAALDRLSAILVNKRVRVGAVEQGDTIRILGADRIELNVLWPPEVKSEYVAVLADQSASESREQILGASAKRGDLNERSVVLELLEGNKRYLLMGDAGFQAEEAMLRSGILQDVDYLKIGHHGSKYASSERFLDKVKPEIAVISVSEKNRYGHPTPETLLRLTMRGVKIRRTDQEGNIVLP